VNALMLAAVLTPFGVALLITLPGPLRRLPLRLAPWSAIPALAAALLTPPTEPVVLPWLLLGARLGLDLTGQVFLLFTALLWTLAGLYARAYLAHDPARGRFWVFHLLTMSGNLGLIVAQDLVTFYVAFALMTFAAYPLVVHAGGAAALRAGRVYIVMAVIGEAMLLAGLIPAALASDSLALDAVAAGLATSPSRDLSIALLLLGFGVKAGALPLHVWLPLAHPVAPTPASAVLSGSMIKAGLLGWLRFLPLGEVALPGWGALMIGAGLAAAFFGVLIGVTQHDAKTALAYSSISQMGLINVAVGIGLSNPAAWPTTLAACLAYATHHGLAKGALFLGVGVAIAAAGRRTAWRLALAGLGFVALAVAGAPLTSGGVAKAYLKDVAPMSPAAWPAVLDWLLPLTAVGTTLLMGRFLLLVARNTRPDPHHPLTPGLWVPWALLLAAVAVVMWVLPHRYELQIDPPGLPYPGAVWMSIWPVVAGALVVWIAVLLARRRAAGPERLHVAPGDLLLPAERVLGGVTRALERLRASHMADPVNPVATLSSRWYGVYARADRQSTMLRLEQRLTRWVTAGLLVISLVAALVLLLRLNRG
jgi:formate hydrogenlyase subunit 3/multisubunit Na+/H+ antiporter MnhD subunit